MTNVNLAELLRTLRNAISTRESCAVESDCRKVFGDMKPIFAIKDLQSGKYSNLQFFETREVAYSVIRRSFRDQYFAGNINYDWMREQNIVCLGEFDDDTGAIWSLDPEAYEVIPCTDFVKDSEIRDDDRSV